MEKLAVNTVELPVSFVAVEDGKVLLTAFLDHTLQFIMEVDVAIIRKAIDEAQRGNPVTE